MKSVKIALAIAVATVLGASMSLSSAAEVKAVQPSSPAAVKAIQPKPAIGGFTAAPGTGKKASGIYCCTPNGCTPVNLLTICVGANNIRYACDANGNCVKEPFGGDN